MSVHRVFYGPGILAKCWIQRSRRVHIVKFGASSSDFCQLESIHCNPIISVQRRVTYGRTIWPATSHFVLVVEGKDAVADGNVGTDTWAYISL